MRTAFALLVFAISSFAQNPSAVSSAQAACGPNGIDFDVKDDNSQHVIEQPEAGKALLYVIQDMGTISCIGGCITTKIGLDGAWIGAVHHSSFLSFAVEPGEHHLCANWQSHFERLSRLVGLVHFTAEGGKIYYFRTRAFGDKNQYLFDLDPLDSDQGRLFVAHYPLSISHTKK